MLKLMLPCLASDRKQLEAKIDLLKEYVGSKYPTGVEIGLRMGDLDDPTVFSTIRDNLSILPSDMVVTIHGAINYKKGFKDNFFQSQKGFENLLKTLRFAREINIELVNIHASAFVSCKRLRILKRDGDINDYRRKALAKVKLDLHKLRELLGLSPIICIENVPSALTVDRIVDPEQAIYELIFVDLLDFLKVINPEKNIFATVDIDHLAQVYDSSQLLSKIQSLGRGLGHVHLSDLRNWQPFISTIEEGLIPGEGRIGERVFKELLEYFVTFAEKQDLGIVLEIEEEDFTKPKNSRVGLKRVVQWLAEL